MDMNRFSIIYRKFQNVNSLKFYVFFQFLCKFEFLKSLNNTKLIENKTDQILYFEFLRFSNSEFKIISEKKIVNGKI